MINLISPNFNINPLRQNKLNSVKRPVLSNFAALKPLSQDTISFTSNSNENSIKDNRTKTLNIDLMHAFDNKEACREVSENANFAKSYLRKILNRSLSNLVISKNNPHGIIDSINIRVKSPDSIREKIANVLGDAIVSENPTAFNPTLNEEIKAHCGDLIGARIIIGKNSKKESAKIINALIEEIKKGNIKVTSIEHYILKDGDNTEEYFTPHDLERLCDAVNKQREKRRLDPIKVIYKEKPSGYMALHLDIDLSSSNFKVKENGYKGEIQIIGHDVCKFKELEDLCYKINSGKDIKGGDCSYMPFIRYFKNQFSNPKYIRLKEYFREYTKRAYIVQKRKVNTNDKNYTFPTIQECKMEGKIPEGLDFNVLNRVKTNCDRLYEISQMYSYKSED